MQRKFTLGGPGPHCTCTQIDSGNYYIANTYINGQIKLFDFSSGTLVNEFQDSTEENAIANFRFAPRNSDGT